MRLGWSRAGGPGAGLEAASKVDKLEAASEVENRLGAEDPGWGAGKVCEGVLVCTGVEPRGLFGDLNSTFRMTSQLQ